MTKEEDLLNDFCEYLDGIVESMWGEWSRHTQNAEEIVMEDIREAKDNFLKSDWREQMKQSKLNIQKQEEHL